MYQLGKIGHFAPVSKLHGEKFQNWAETVGENEPFFETQQTKRILWLILQKIKIIDSDTC
jgi:hypothetical protein